MKRLYIFALLLLVACAGNKAEPLYNCHSVVWYRYRADGYQSLNLAVDRLNRTQNKNREEASLAVEQHIDLVCDPSEIFYCEDRTENSYITSNRLMKIEDRPVSSIFCIPIELDRDDAARKYVEENVEPGGGVKKLFPFDDR